MIVLFNKVTGQRVTDFGDQQEEMTDYLWQYVQDAFNLASEQIVIGDVEPAQLAGKDLSQMVAVISGEQVVSWSAPDYVAPLPEPQPPTSEERLTALENAFLSSIGL